MDLESGIETVDDESVRFRIASVRVAVALSLIVGAGTEVYLLATWDAPHRALLTVTVGVGIMSVLAVALMPTERIVRTRWREPFFAGWSSLLAVLIAIAAAADGGPDSPIVVLFPLPLIFAALTYAPLSVLVVAAVDIVAFVVVALIEPAGTAESVFIGFALLSAAMMCIWQAHNRSRQDERLGAMAAALEHSESVSHMRATQQREVAAFGQRALSGDPVEELMQDASSTLQRVLEVDLAGVLELEPDGESLVLRANVGLPSEMIGSFILPAGAGSQAGYTLESDRPVIVGDWAEETRFEEPELGEMLGVSSGVTVPIRVGGTPFGILDLQTFEVRRFGRDDVNFLQSIANVLASAIERRNEAEDAVHRALHDPLTGLPNRALFEDRLGRALAEQERRGSSVAVIFLDIDHFKLVNDSLGHQAGDELLKAVAPRLRQALRPGDTVARFGGDEFGILLEDVADESDATRVAERIAAALAKPFVVWEREHFVTASSGIAVGGAGQLAEAMIRDSDAAMYRAKERGRARYEIFDEAMRVRVAHRLRIENELRSAIECNELRVHYLPVVSLASGMITGAEALVRWEHPQHGLMDPRDFIPVAEESRLIGAVGRWVLETACRETAAWHAANPDRPPVEISVNMSVRQLGDRELIQAVRRALTAAGVDAMNLSLELTEGALVEETESAFAALTELKRLGVRFALDDFGTGYSSLGSLQRLPFDAIKLDRSFVERLGHDGVDKAIVTAVVALAQTMALSVVAEGIETKEQLAIVTELGCHRAQGFLFSRPVLAHEFARLLEADRPMVGRAV
jgi:diguanylate cyclase (GGDEF)-like protein